MKLSPLTLYRLRTLIIGDEGQFPRLTGEEILKLFHKAGFKDIYDSRAGGMPNGISRKVYTFDRLKEINGKKELQIIIESVISKAHFLNTGFDQSEAIKMINTILVEDNYSIIDVGGSFKVEGVTVPDTAIIEAHFEENRTKIIAEIRKAKFLIWVAVAWLTDKALLTELRKKREEGLNIQIVTQDDVINAELKEHVMKAFEAYYKMPVGAYKNLMHHKFCIIDLKTVVHGSYNWTIKAQYNQETVTVNHSTEFAADFAETFMKLKKA